MNKFIKNCLALAALCGVLSSCGGEDLDDVTAETISADITTADITFDQSDLVGTWILESMTSNVPVDFNDPDAEENTNILAETNCFNGMNYIFDASGNVTATQARLYFNSTGIETCNSGTYNATYTLTGDQLRIDFVFNGESTYEIKTIELSEDKQFLSIALNRTEASGYINDDSGTSTSQIGEVDMVYKKAN